MRQPERKACEPSVCPACGGNFFKRLHKGRIQQTCSRKCSSVEKGKARSIIAESRFLSRVRESDGGCLLYTGTCGSNGYGVTQYRGKKASAHRLAWRMLRGPIPDGLFVCHRCDVPLCINIEHLFLGTNEDNMADQFAKGRHTYGQRNGEAKLTEAQAKELLRRKVTGERTRALAKEYGIHESQVARIARGEAWKHLSGATS